MASEVGSSADAGSVSDSGSTVGLFDDSASAACGSECAEITALSALAFRRILAYPWNHASEYEERRVEDRGSIAQSMERTPIDLFQRTVVPRSRVGQFLRALARAVTSVFAGFLAGGAGVLYHLRLVETHFFRWLFSRDDLGSASEWQKVALHGKAVLFDLAIFFCSAFGLFSIAIGVRDGNPLSALGGVALLSPLLIESVLHPSHLTDFSTARRSVAYKSYMLKEKYGIVNQDGEILSWDANRDVEFRSAYFPDTRGYLGTLFREQGLAFLGVVRRLQERLPPQCKLPAVYPPSARSIGYFLDRNRGATGLSDAEVEEWKRQFHAHENNFKEIGLIMQECFSLQFSEFTVTRYLALPTFPIDSLRALGFFAI